LRRSLGEKLQGGRQIELLHYSKLSEHCNRDEENPEAAMRLRLRPPEERKMFRTGMTLSDASGYLASTMVLLTFLTKDMRMLRVLAIGSNVAFATYGLMVWLPPVFCLHFLLLPINAVRLREMLAAQSSRLPVAGTMPFDESWSSLRKFATCAIWRSLQPTHSKSL
jgi:hypothetical protein